jgi:neurocan core protein
VNARLDIPYILENLEPQTIYSFRFAAKNQVGYGEWSREETHTMPKRAAPEEPYIIAKTENKVVSTPYADRYELLWSAPPNNGEPIDYFEVAYYPVSFFHDIVFFFTRVVFFFGCQFYPQ